MYFVSLDIIISGTFPSDCICHVQCLIWYRIQVISNLPKLCCSRFYYVPTRTYLQLSAAVNHGVNGSVYVKWHDAFLSFLLNSSWIISLVLSHITAGSAPSYWKRRSNASWASLFSFVGNEHDQPKSVANIYAHLLPLLDNIVTNNISLYTYVAIFYTMTDDHLS